MHNIIAHTTRLFDQIRPHAASYPAPAHAPGNTVWRPRCKLWTPRRRLNGNMPNSTILSLLAWATLAAAQSPPLAATLAPQVMIYRDTYGTPHVFGRTDASVVFGFAYAQAEDTFPQLEENFVLALGRGAELYGPALVDEDRLSRALEIGRFAKADYRALDPKVHALCDAFAAGVNYYLQRHPTVHPRLLGHIEPWYPLAFIRYNYYQNGFARDPKLGSQNFRTAYFDRTISSHNGSNGWVIAPSRSATGHAMLFIDPHLPFFGPGQVYEGHLHSDEGWEFTGYARFGFPFPYIGHNAFIGWMSTDNVADAVDGYVEHFDDPQRPLAYRYGTGYRIANEHTETIRVKTPSGFDTRTFRMVRTHHGPLVASFQGEPVAARLPKYESHGWLEEWYQMTKARNLTALKTALAPLDMLFGNVMSADRDGNIFYVYNAAVPRRDSGFDWTKPVDGANPRTEWQGYYPLEALPQLTNPATGWMENCNTSPFLLTSAGNPDPQNYPKYMVREGTFPGWDANNPRGRASQRILSQTRSFTFDEWTRAAFDTHVVTADELLPGWLANLDPTDSDSRAAAEELKRWDHRSTTTSVAMTLFTFWHRAMGDEQTTASHAGSSLHDVLGQLTSRFGTWHVPYGELNRLQRSTAYSKPPFGNPVFSDDEPSVASPGVSEEDGAPYTLRTVPGKQGRRQYGVHGDTYVSVVEFGPSTHALSVMTFGESADPKSSHFIDQAPLYAQGQFKPSWFTLDEVKQHAEKHYHPGDEAAGR